MLKPTKTKKEKEFIKKALLELPLLSNNAEMIFKKTATFEELIAHMQLEHF
jgi:hypothetical protein